MSLSTEPNPEYWQDRALAAEAEAGEAVRLAYAYCIGIARHYGGERGEQIAAAIEEHTAGRGGWQPMLEEQIAAGAARIDHREGVDALNFRIVS